MTARGISSTMPSSIIHFQIGSQRNGNMRSIVGETIKRIRWNLQVILRSIHREIVGVYSFGIIDWTRTVYMACQINRELRLFPHHLAIGNLQLDNKESWLKVDV